MLIQVHYTATGEYTVSPQSLNFGAVSNTDTPKERSAVIASSATTANIRLLSAPRGIAVRMEPTPDGRHSLLHAKLSTRMLPPRGVLNERIVLATGNKKQPQIIVPIVAAVGSPSSPAR